MTKPTKYGWFWGNAKWNKNSPDGCYLQTIINTSILPENVPLYNTNPKRLQFEAVEFAHKYSQFRKYPCDSFRQAAYRAIKAFDQGKTINAAEVVEQPTAAAAGLSAEQKKEDFKESQKNYKSGFALGMLQGKSGGVNPQLVTSQHTTTDMMFGMPPPSMVAAAAQPQSWTGVPPGHPGHQPPPQQHHTGVSAGMQDVTATMGTMSLGGNNVTQHSVEFRTGTYSLIDKDVFVVGFDSPSFVSEDMLKPVQATLANEGKTLTIFIHTAKEMTDALLFCTTTGIKYDPNDARCIAIAKMYQGVENTMTAMDCGVVARKVEIALPWVAEKISEFVSNESADGCINVNRIEVVRQNPSAKQQFSTGPLANMISPTGEEYDDGHNSVVSGMDMSLAGSMAGSRAEHHMNKKKKKRVSSGRSVASKPTRVHNSGQSVVSNATRASILFKSKSKKACLTSPPNVSVKRHGVSSNTKPAVPTYVAFLPERQQKQQQHTPPRQSTAPLAQTMFGTAPATLGTAAFVPTTPPASTFNQNGEAASMPPPAAVFQPQMNFAPGVGMNFAPGVGGVVKQFSPSPLKSPITDDVTRGAETAYTEETIATDLYNQMMRSQQQGGPQPLDNGLDEDPDL